MRGHREQCPFIHTKLTDLELRCVLAQVVERQIRELAAVLNVQILQLYEDTDSRHVTTRHSTDIDSPRQQILHPIDANIPGQLRASTSIASSVRRKQPERLTVCSFGQIVESYIQYTHNQVNPCKPLATSGKVTLYSHLSRHNATQSRTVPWQ